MTRILGVVLAGGKATRMGGGDKGLLPLGDATLLDHVLERFAPQCARLAINANGDAARFSRFRLPVIPDTLPDYPGPLAGVLAGLDWAADEGGDAIVTVAADTPFLPRYLVARLRDAAVAKAVPIALAASPDEAGAARRHPTFGLWPVALRDDLRAELSGGLRKIVLWADRYGVATVQFQTERFDPFFNVNTPEDMTRAAAMLAGGDA
ncbi:molybdenum cofactor guanylyltransferase MobA [Mesorhizobium sp. CAU 1732]|uniref:molybdenum cofactor guanylyltransferase MobA n=1 Tax=Mesorhizobium sp. CAU 1732 TaxID=3140358 RepID=UPI0032603755